jgi:hypothetical protein
MVSIMSEVSPLFELELSLLATMLYSGTLAVGYKVLLFGGELSPRTEDNKIRVAVVTSTLAKACDKSYLRSKDAKAGKELLVSVGQMGMEKNGTTIVAAVVRHFVELATTPAPVYERDDNGTWLRQSAFGIMEPVITEREIQFATIREKLKDAVLWEGDLAGHFRNVGVVGILGVAMRHSEFHNLVQYLKYKYATENLASVRFGGMRPYQKEQGADMGAGMSTLEAALPVMELQLMFVDDFKEEIEQSNGGKLFDVSFVDDQYSMYVQRLMAIFQVYYQMWGPKLGMKQNWEKSQLLLGQDVSWEIYKELLREAKVLVEDKYDMEVDISELFEQKHGSIMEAKLKVMGTVITPKADIATQEEFVEEKVSEWIEKLVKLDGWVLTQHDRHKILQSCHGRPKTAHLMRTTPLVSLNQMMSMRKYDNEYLDRVLAATVRITVPLEQLTQVQVGMMEVARVQAGMPMAGMGLGTLVSEEYWEAATIGGRND